MTDMITMMLDNLGALVLATGALGTAAFGIVEGLKRWRVLAEAGFGVIAHVLGPIAQTLQAAYGSDVDALLRALYRGEQQEMARVLRQGARIGLTPGNAESIAANLGTINPTMLKSAALAIERGDELSSELRNTLGRYELAVDARIDAALTLAQSRYAGAARITAYLIAISIAALVARFYFDDPRQRGAALLIGLAAVPLAPIAKDVVGAIKAVGDALRAKMS